MARSNEIGKPAKEASPLISVLIVAYQSGPTLARCLAGLEAQTFRDFEIILIDNASVDGAPQKAAANSAVQLIEPGGNLGFAAGNNLAARHARGRWLALLNPDAYPDPRWLEMLVAAAARHADVSCFASLQMVADEPGLMDGAGDVMTSAGIPFRGGYRRRLPKDMLEGEVFSACGAATLIDRRIFLRLGGFDDRFFCYCEDVDLGYRMRLAGERTLLIPEARVEHVGSASTGVRSDFALFHGSRNRIWTFLKNTPPLMLWLTLPLHVAVTAGLLLLHLRRGDAKAVIRGIRAAFARDDLSSILESRRAIQADRKAGSASILRIMALDPVAFLGRRVVIRRWKGLQSAGA
ncbi:glycosyltransferase family 2 protein [Caulobacter sp. UNC279MFTsu5.1]|uniref:glycosyltransferase family 2 protein n=1 Tax=Caulobacter sp. UNC279MFTsu5.1 TaxID=1502775 RepID=UPI0003758EC7|nr:glycosyltransferase family 2 protein [Caulobacter sp. UNC279MFTsu5.1]SFJ47389.1 Glycosyltransferase, GT2 family [Caulobacter sp. UNC279MFTsu5.1]